MRSPTPDAAIAALMERNPAADAALETERLQMAIDANVLTDYVMANGMGGIDDGTDGERDRADRKSVYEFVNEPDASLYFDGSYLPDGRHADAAIKQIGPLHFAAAHFRSRLQDASKIS